MLGFIGRQLARILINLLVRLWLVPRDRIAAGRQRVARTLDAAERDTLAELLADFSLAQRFGVADDVARKGAAILDFINGAIARRLAA